MLRAIFYDRLNHLVEFIYSHLMYKKISYIIILCISLFTISGCKICLFGKTERVRTNYGKAYWKAVDSKKSKYIQEYTQACNKEAEAAKNQVDAIFEQLCSKGHIPKEYLPQAQMIQNDYLKYHYNNYVKDPNVKDILRIGTIDEIYKRFVTGSYDKTPSNERMVKACALYIPKNGIVYDYNLNLAFDPQFDTYKKFYFERCMTNFNLIKITPVTTKKETICKGIMW